jgi:hypothetical protein
VVSDEYLAERARAGFVSLKNGSSLHSERELVRGYLTTEH